MNDHSFFQYREILAPTNDIVDTLNNYIMTLIPCDEKTYLSADSSCSFGENNNSLDDIHTLEFLNTINSSGLPTYELRLKIGVPIMLLRIINQQSGLCNGTPLIIT